MSAHQAGVASEGSGRPEAGAGASVRVLSSASEEQGFHLLQGPGVAWEEEQESIPGQVRGEVRSGPQAEWQVARAALGVGGPLQSG